MPRFLATIVIEADSERDAEEQLQAELFGFIQNVSISLHQGTSESPEQASINRRADDVETLSRLSHLDLTNRLTQLLDALYGGSYYKRFSEIAKARGRKIESSHFSRMDTASLQLLIETIESLHSSPELREARLTAEEVLRIMSTREGNLFAEDMREFIGCELDLTDAALLEAWETIEQDRMKKEGYK
jgi:hypothetical protein